MAAPKKQSKLKIRANLKKFILPARFNKKLRLKNPTKKLKIKAGQPSAIKTGFSKNK